MDKKRISREKKVAWQAGAGQQPQQKPPANGKAAPPGGAARGFKWTKKHTLVAACAAAAVFALTILVVVLARPGAVVLDDSASSSSGAALSLPTSEQARAEVAQAARLLAGDTFTGTVLTETGDAGKEYVEDTLFLGDSNTVRMMYYTAVTGVGRQNAIGVVGMGIQAFTTEKCVQFEGDSKWYTMPQAAEKLQPRRIVITFGSNNAAGMRVDTFIAHYEKALEELKKACPDTDIIIGGVFPVDKYCENEYISNAHIANYNLALAELAKTQDVKFLNWSEALVEEETGNCGFDYTLIDGIHLTKAGMDQIFTYFRTHSYITTDRRPAASKAAPKIAGGEVAQVTADPYKPPGPYPKKPASSSSSSSSSSVAQLPVTVVYGTWNSTAGTSGGGTVSTGTVSGLAGETVAGATAVPAEGYTFAGWGCSTGSIAAPGNPSLGGFTIPAAVTPGSTITVTAYFTQTVVPSSSAPPEESSSQNQSQSQPAEQSSSQPQSESQSQSQSNQEEQQQSSSAQQETGQPPQEGGAAEEPPAQEEAQQQAEE